MSVGRLSMTFGWNKIGCFVVALCVSAAGAQLTAASEGGCQRHDSQARVALAVQGECLDLPLWQTLLSRQHHLHQIQLFFLAYDKHPKECQLPGFPSDPSALIHGPNTTWTGGRNALAKAIYWAEQGQGLTFKYWLFADADMVHLECHYCRHLEGEFQPACCYDQLVHFLLGSGQFAVVAVNAYQQDEGAHGLFSRHECPDAMLNAFHRAAVPILLPYDGGLDSISWW